MALSLSIRAGVLLDSRWLVVGEFFSLVVLSWGGLYSVN